MRHCGFGHTTNCKILRRCITGSDIVYWFVYKAGNLEHSELIIFLIGLAALIVLHLKLLFHLLIWSQTVGCTRIAGEGNFNWSLSRRYGCKCSWESTSKVWKIFLWYFCRLILYIQLAFYCNYSWIVSSQTDALLYLFRDFPFPFFFLSCHGLLCCVNQQIK